MKTIKCLRFTILMIMTVVFTMTLSAQKKGESVTVFDVKLDCQNCVNKVEKNIAFVKGVKDLKCSLTEQTVEVTYKTGKTNDSILISEFKKINIEAVPQKVKTPGQEPNTTAHKGCCTGHK